MILAYAGRRPSGPAGDLPASREEYLQERADRLLAGLRPARIVGSAAAGSDLILLEAAARLQIPATVLLAGDVDAFAADSVEDKPGWRGRFDAVIGSPLTTVELVDATTGGDAYRAVTRRIIERASELAAEAKTDNPETELLGLVVSGGNRGDDDYTEALGRGLEAAGHFVLRLDPRQGRRSSPMAFVAMPFGRKKDPTNRMRWYASDASWERLILPALLDGGYRAVRADVEASLILIDARMVSNLFAADLVVADIATHNPNVFWELGVRHTARRRGTLVVGPKWTAPPFDVKAVPVQTYAREAIEVTDTQVVEGLRTLRRALRAATADVAGAEAPDSPVHSAIPGLTMPVAPVAIDRGANWLERITIAAELRNSDQLLALLDDVAHADLASSSQDYFRFQIVLGLIRLHRHAEAASALQTLAEADENFDNEPLQQTYGHALVRSARRTAEGDAQLMLAENRLRVLDGRHPNSSETLGLLGSAAKERALRRRLAGQDATEELRLAADSYERGFAVDPSDYYPGVNAVATRRLLGQRARGRKEDSAAARELLPVVRFAVTRLGVSIRDVWSHATLGELALQESLLGSEQDEEVGRRALQHYRTAAAHADPHQLHSMNQQLEMLLDWGDPPALVQPLIAVVNERM